MASNGSAITRNSEARVAGARADRPLARLLRPTQQTSTFVFRCTWTAALREMAAPPHRAR